MCKHPTFCQELIPAMQEYVGYCNASKLGAGSVWMSGKKFINPPYGD
jgi:hypothetical protein